MSRGLGRALGGPLGPALLVAGAACTFGAISTLAVFATRAYGTHAAAPLDAVLAWRYTLAALALVPIAAAGWRRAGAWPAVGAAGWIEAVGVGGLGQAAVAFLSLSAVRYIPVATLGFLFYTFPAWVALFAAAGGERLDRVKLGALVLSLAGIACTVGLPGGAAAPPPGAPVVSLHAAWPGVALALGAAVVYALYIPFLGRTQQRLGPAGAAAAVCVGAGAILVGTGLARGTFTAHLAAPAWGAVGTMAFVCTVVAFVAFMRGLAQLGPVRTAIVSTVEPFFTAVLGALVLAQPFGAATVAGGVLIAAAVLLLQRPTRAASALHPGAGAHDPPPTTFPEVPV